MAQQYFILLPKYYFYPTNKQSFPSDYAKLVNFQLVHDVEDEAEREGGELSEGQHRKGIQHLHAQHQIIQIEQQQTQGQVTA